MSVAIKAARLLCAKEITLLATPTVRCRRAFADDAGGKEPPPYKEIVSKTLTERGTMLFNPMIRRLRQKPPQNFPKQTTGLTGLNVNEYPHRSLSVVYGRILRTLQKFPSDSFYRQSTEAIVNQRLQILQSEDDIERVEDMIGMGQIEEVIQQAEFELDCARTLADHRVWEPLVSPAPGDQWKWPV